MANIEHKLSDIRSDWARRGYTFEYWIDPPGQVWRDFEHEVEELVVLVEGEIEIEFAGKRVRPPVGAEILIPARTRHTVTNSGDTPNRWCFGYLLNKTSSNSGEQHG
jgi:mannose-6-phosphate isomerase-like protein (cupin superfamily)